jgi:SAGA-associated factor 29
MDRRRHNPPRAATTEGKFSTARIPFANVISRVYLELETWSLASQSLNRLSEMYDDPAPVETVNRVNRLITAWPQDDRPAEGYEGVKTVYKKLRSGLNEIQIQAKSEVE